MAVGAAHLVLFPVPLPWPPHSWSLTALAHSLHSLLVWTKDHWMISVCVAQWLRALGVKLAAQAGAAAEPPKE